MIAVMIGVQVGRSHSDCCHSGCSGGKGHLMNEVMIDVQVERITG